MPGDTNHFEKDYIYWMTQTSHAYHRLFNVLSARYGVTFRQSQVLGYLVKEGQMTQSELVERMGVESPTLVGLLDRMQKDGWITRVASNIDRRRNYIKAGTKLNDVWQNLQECSQEVRAKSSESLTAEEMEVLISLLKRVHSNLTGDDVITSIISKHLSQRSPATTPHDDAVALQSSLS